MRLYQTSATFTRPNNGHVYAGWELVANSTVAGSVVPMTFSIPNQGFLLTSVKIVDGSGNSTNFLIHLFQFSPTLTIGDGTTVLGGNFLVTNDSGYLGAIPVDGTQYGAFVQNADIGFNTIDPYSFQIFTDTTPTVDGNTTNIYGLLTTGISTAGYTPGANKTYTITLRGID